jgi:ribosomal protein S18 acetylase RimI-like enzyme
MAGFEPIEENLRATLAAFGRARPEGETRELEGVTVTSAAVAYSMFNSAVLTAPVASPRELERRIGRAAEFFAARGLGWSFWVCQGWMEGRVRGVVADVCYGCGLHEVAEMPGMEAEGLAPAGRALPALEYRPVSERDAETRADFSYIMTAAFGVPLPVANKIYGSQSTWSGEFTGWVGYSEGVAVTSAATLATNAAVGVYAVGTPPSHRRKGYGEAMVRHALQEARAAGGAERSVLESSEAGLLLYRRMGYRAVTRYAVFAT